MKITCNIIKDLLLIYKEDVSDDTKKIVDDHLVICEECRNYYSRIYEAMQDVELIKSENVEVEKQDKVVKKGFRKIRKRWIASILCVIILVPVIGFGGRLTANQVRGKGLNFENMDDVYLCEKYLKSIKDKDFETAYDMMDVSHELHSLKETYELYSGDKNLKTFEDINLNNSEWSIYKDAVTYDGKDEKAFWENVIYSNKQNILIPEIVWDSIVPKPVIQKTDWYGTEIVFYYVEEKKEWEEDDYYISPYENQGFVRVETLWGNFYVFGELTYTIDGSKTYAGADMIIESADSALDLYWTMDVLPKEIVMKAVKEIEASRNESLEWLTEKYGDVLDMTDEEYTNYVKEQYKKTFNRFWEKGYSITDIAYIDKDQSVEILSYDETIVMHVEVQNAEGEKKTGKIVLGIQDNKVVVNSFEGSSIMIEALYNAMTNNFLI